MDYALLGLCLLASLALIGFIAWWDTLPPVPADETEIHWPIDHPMYDPTRERRHWRSKR